MIFNSIMVAGLAVALGAPADLAQSAAELLQKGIYAQETLGKTDSAIQIYRQILKSDSVQPDVATQAHYRLAQSLVKKGDLQGAALEARELMKDPGNKDLIQNLSRSLFAAQSALQSVTAADIAKQCATPELGVIQNGRYHNKKTGLEFEVPLDWTVVCTSPASGNGEMAMVLQNSKPGPSIAVWMVQENIPAGDIPARLRWDLAEKEGTRRAQFSESYGYRMDSVRDTTVNGQPALTALADFPEPGTKQPMTECHTWIYTTKTRAYIFGRVRTSDLDEFRQVYEKLVSSAIVP